VQTGQVRVEFVIVVWALALSPALLLCHARLVRRSFSKQLKQLYVAVGAIDFS
jgi:hypothetical protein